MGRTPKNEFPFCFKCKFFYKEKGKKYASAHCPFDLYNTCAGRLYGADMGEKYKRKGEEE